MDIETEQEQEILRLLVGSHKAGRVAIKRHRGIWYRARPTWWWKSESQETILWMTK